MNRYSKSFLTLFPILLMRVGFLIFGWGFGSWRAWFSSPPRAALMISFVLSFGVGVALAVDLNPFRQTGSSRQSPVPIALGELGLLFSYALVAFLDHHSIFVFPDKAWLRWVGVSFWLVGDVVRLFALRELGRQYSSMLTIQADHKLIETGLYRWLRHPYYLGQILVEPGIFLVLRSPLAILVLACSVPFVVHRIAVEERVLIAHFGPRYEAYRHRTWRALPFLY